MSRSFAHAPSAGHPVPPMMDSAAGGAPVTLVWLNEAGGLTGRVEGGAQRYLKWNPPGSGESLAAEVERLRWLEGRHPAARVIGYTKTDAGELMVTAALPGRSAVDSSWLADPVTAVRAIAEGLRTLHALPVGDCPFSWSVASRIEAAGRAGGVVPAALSISPPVDLLVICHGDACAPNTLIAADGRFLAHVDLGRLGVADRWADLAIASMSLDWNYAGVDESLFWDAYGIEPDRERIAYYRALWDAT